MGNKAIHEEAYVRIGRNRYAHYKSNRTEMVFSKEEKKNMYGRILFHNHPYRTLSEDDIGFAVENGLKEIHAVSSKFLFSAKFNPPIIISPKEFNDKLEKAANNVFFKKMHANSKEADEIMRDLQHYIIKELSNIIGFEYKVTPLAGT